MMLKVGVFFSLFVFAMPSLGFKFLCNGMDADGVAEPDNCGICTESTAPRWIPSSVDVWVDLKTRPSNISESAWKAEAIAGLQAWKDVPGINLDLRYAGHSEHRSFGIDANLHEIFWVLSKEEWRQKVGSGENGTLGVTVSPYQCPASGRQSREIYDADLIMNGTGKFKWKVDCRAERNCESIKSTLVHELGHFIGIGHPCTDCDWSVMSASGGNDLHLPLPDDHSAVQTLYPSGQAGQMGMHCENSSDCKENLQCIEHNDVKYCSQECGTANCPAGFACDGGVCRFAIGRLAPPAGLREPCETRPCKDGLMCELTYTNKSYCVQSCLTKQDCSGDEQCVLFADGGAGVCLQIAELNEACGEFTTCGEKLVCVGKSANGGVCKEECDPKRKRCRSGGICTAVGSKVWACI